MDPNSRHLTTIQFFFFHIHTVCHSSHRPAVCILDGLCFVTVRKQSFEPDCLIYLVPFLLLPVLNSPGERSVCLVTDLPWISSAKHMPSFLKKSNWATFLLFFNKGTCLSSDLGLPLNPPPPTSHFPPVFFSAFTLISFIMFIICSIVVIVEAQFQKLISH